MMDKKNIPKISVVMAVFNGEKYIEKQLYSIYNQSLCPDELIIIDDCSKDRSIEIIRRIGLEEKIKKVIVLEHKENKGYAATFFEGLCMSSGDYIFLSDQDDIWNLDKIKNMIQIMLQNQGISCLSCKFNLIDAQGKCIGKEKKKSSGLEQISMKDLLRQNMLRPGMALVINREIISKLNEIDLNNFLSHDRLVEFISCCNDGLYICNQYLIDYRIHNKNTSGMNRSYKLRTGLQGRINKAEEEKRYLVELKKISEENIFLIDKFVNYQRKRIQLLSYSSIIKYAFAAIPLIQYMGTPKIYLGDIYSIILKNAEK